MEQTKTPVRLRRRTTSTGKQSLYLDIYINGKRKYEYLKLYLVPERTREDREQNREALAYAEAVRAKRLVEVQNGKYGFEDGYALGASLFAFVEELIGKRYSMESTGNWGNWRSFYRHLREYCREKDMTLGEVTTEWVQGFRDYLDRVAVNHNYKKSKPPKLSQNAKAGYFNKMRCVMNTAFDDGLIPRNPARNVAGFKEEETERCYLTLDEVRKLYGTDCKYPVLKRAYLFSCLTGLRKSDIQKLTWAEVRLEGEHVRLVFRQKKTGGQEYLDVSPEAVEFLGDRGEDDARVFEGFTYDHYMQRELRAWCQRAGVNKSPTFHSGRHTFAVLMLDLGADIYTVSKLLGHRELRTTQVYAALLDKKKQAAVSLIPSLGK